MKKQNTYIIFNKLKEININTNNFFFPLFARSVNKEER